MTQAIIYFFNKWIHLELKKKIQITSSVPQYTHKTPDTWNFSAAEKERKNYGPSVLWR